MKFNKKVTLLDLPSMENLLFEVGQLAEERSFDPGFRGAWFRCKINDITEKKGIPECLLEPFDYPDDKPRWTRICKVPPHCRGNRKEKCRELILRPQYPPIYNEKQVPHVNEISEVVVIVCDSWKVGDSVDWMTEGCFWCGNITEVFDDQEAQIELRPPPRGEGGSYRVLMKDLRPSLDWSPEHGWTIPTQEDGTGNPCARLTKPISQVIDTMVRVVDARDACDEDIPHYVGLNGDDEDVPHVVGLNDGNEDVPHSLRLNTGLFSSLVSSNSTSSSEVKSTSKIEMKKSVQGTTLSTEQKNHNEKNASHGCKDSNIKETSRVDIDFSQSTSGNELASSEVKNTSKIKTKECVREITLLKEHKNDVEKNASHGREDSNIKDTRQANTNSSNNTTRKEVEVVVDDINRKRFMARGGDTLNSKRSRTIEATVLDLEEYINKVKWLKKMLQHGISSSKNQRP